MSEANKNPTDLDVAVLELAKSLGIVRLLEWLTERIERSNEWKYKTIGVELIVFAVMIFVATMMFAFLIAGILTGVERLLG